MTILLLLSSYAFASSSTLPKVTFAKTKMTAEMPAIATVLLPGNSSIGLINSGFPNANDSSLNADQSTLDPASSPGAPLQGVYASQPLGRLAAIAWNNLDTLGYPSFFMQLLILPSNYEAWLQWIAPGEDPDTRSNGPIVNVVLPQETDPADVLLLSMNTRGDVGVSCSGCHSLPNSMYPTLVALNNQPSIPKQGHPGTIVDCVVCHTQEPQQISSHFRGVQ